MERYYNTAKLSKARKEALRTQIVFYRNNKSLMNYAEHVANGWPIGSGPVEAACKSIVKTRFCQSGMRWSTQGGRNILALRVLTNSNQWDVIAGEVFGVFGRNKNRFAKRLCGSGNGALSAVSCFSRGGLSCGSSCR